MVSLSAILALVGTHVGTHVGSVVLAYFAANGKSMVAKWALGKAVGMVTGSNKPKLDKTDPMRHGIGMVEIDPSLVPPA